MIKTVLAAVAMAVAAVSSVAVAQTAPTQTAPAQDHAAHAGHETHAARPTIDSTIKDLLADPATAAVLEAHLPGVSQHPALPQFQDMTLAQVAPMSGGQVTPAIIEAIDADLKALPAH